MAQTITPVVHGGRRGRWGLTLALHVAGAAAAAAVLGAAAGAVGSLLGAPWGRASGVVVAVVALAYGAREVARVPVPVPELRRQVPEWWRETFSPGRAAFLYGAGLGVGFLTHLRHGTLVAVVAAAVALGDPWVGAAALAPFGLARSLAVAAVWRGTTRARLGEALTAIERLGEGGLRRTANAVALLAVAVMAARFTAASGEGFPAAVPTGLLAATFIWAALAKAARGAAWESALDGFALPRPLRRAAATGVPVLEAGAAGLLLAGATAAGAALALALLAAFSAAIIRRRGPERLPCGCFGGSGTRSAGWLLGRNAALAVLSLVVLTLGAPVPVPPPPGPGETLPAILVVGGTVLAWMLFGRAAALWRRGPQTSG